MKGIKMRARLMKGFKFAHLTVFTVLLPVVTGIVEAGPQDELSVVASLTVYRDLAKEILGERGEAASIASARQDPHFVQAKPSYAVMVSRADLMLATVLDLELWMPAVIDKSRNPRVREGERGYVSIATDVPMLQVPDNPSRAGGDIHLFGNPHVHTDPLRAVIVANNIILLRNLLIWRVYFNWFEPRLSTRRATINVLIS